MLDFDKTIISQYQHSPRIMLLARSFAELMEPDSDIRKFYEQAFNPETAQGWGLDDWGRIVAIDRTLRLPGEHKAFGFKDSGLLPFDQAPFYSVAMSDTYELGDDAYRLLIWCKAASNITDGSLPDLNRIMAKIFHGRGKPPLVLHVGTMVIRYVFEFELKKWERGLILRDDIPPVPAGVGYEVLLVTRPAFGFAGSGLLPFDQGTFSEGVLHAYSVPS